MGANSAVHCARTCPTAPRLVWVWASQHCSPTSWSYGFSELHSACGAEVGKMVCVRSLATGKEDTPGLPGVSLQQTSRRWPAQVLVGSLFGKRGRWTLVWRCVLQTFSLVTWSIPMCPRYQMMPGLPGCSCWPAKCSLLHILALRPQAFQAYWTGSVLSLQGILLGLWCPSLHLGWEGLNHGHHQAPYDLAVLMA